MGQVIQFPQKIVNDLIAASASKRETHAFTAHLAERDASEFKQTYLCRKCGSRVVTHVLPDGAPLDCRCGTRMEAK